MPKRRRVAHVLGKSPKMPGYADREGAPKSYDFTHEDTRDPPRRKRRRTPAGNSNWTQYA